MTIIRQKKTANQCGQWSSFLEKKPRSSMLTFFFHLLKVYGELTFQSVKAIKKKSVLEIKQDFKLKL